MVRRVHTEKRFFSVQTSRGKEVIVVSKHAQRGEDPTKKPKKKKGPSEFEDQCAVFKALAANEEKFPFLYFIFAVPNGAYRSKAIAGKSKGEGQKSGVPDIILPFQRHGHPGMYIENKAGKNSLEPNQKRFKEHLESEGYIFKLCKSRHAQIEAIEWYLGIKLKLPLDFNYVG